MRNILLCFFIIIFQNVNSQVNLVPNFSFENIISCPNLQGGSFYSYTPPWYSPNGGTPDIYNSCYTISNQGVGVPYNYTGYQQAHTGNGYGGFAREGQCAAEYLSVKLTSALKPGNKYCISFFVNPGNYTYYVIDAIGAYISTDSISVSGYCILPFTPQIENPLGNIISDTVNWTEISGEYIATGGEQYITIGSFFPDSMIHKAYNDTIHPPGLWPYYYLDDVSVMLCNPQGIEEQFLENNISIYPNPTKNNLTINVAQKATIEILNIQGQLIKTLATIGNKTNIDISALAKGMYFVKVKTEKGVESRKFVKL